MKKYGLVVIALLYFITFAFAGEVTKTVNVKYFFPAQEDWFSVPNWFYYWTDGLGYVGQYSYDPTMTGAYGSTIVYSATSWEVKIGPASYSSAGIPPTGNKYINGFKAVVLHEFWHRDHRVHNFTAYGHYGNTADPLPISVDPDQDGIDNEWEAMIGTDPNVWNSTENGAEWAETHGTYGHEGIDWAHPGSQWE